MVQWLRLRLPTQRAPVLFSGRRAKSPKQNRSHIITNSIRTLKVVHIKNKRATVRKGFEFTAPFWRPHVDSGFSRLPISIVEFVLSQGWLIVILDSMYCVGIFAYETLAGLHAGAALLLFCLSGTGTKDFSPSSSKVSCENSPLGCLI